MSEEHVCPILNEVFLPVEAASWMEFTCPGKLHFV